MLFFDAHADVWTDIVQCRNKNIQNRLRQYHHPRMTNAGMMGGIFVIWVDPPFDVNPQTRTLESLKYMHAELHACKDITQLVTSYSDFGKAKETGKLAIVAGMEGLAALNGDPDWLYALYAMGIRHASLTWNEENAFATGARGTSDRGLTESGKRAVLLMEQLGMLVDVSHANEKCFWDIYENSSKPFIASHSNCMSLCHNRRNLTDEQLVAIAKRRGVVGINAYSPFIHDSSEKRNIDGLVENIDHMVSLMGIDSVGFGFDFGDYLPSETLSHFQEGDIYAAQDIGSVEYVPALLHQLHKRGYSAEDIKKICEGNMLRIFKDILSEG